MTVSDAYADRRRADVMEETWGHLAPRPGVYAADVLFAVGCYSEVLVIIESTVGDLPDSPWLYDDLLRLLEDAPTDPGVYRYSGIYRVLKSGEGRWKGSTKRQVIS